MQIGEHVNDNRAKRSDLHCRRPLAACLAYVGRCRTPGTGSVMSSSWLCTIKLLAHAHSWHTHSGDKKKEKIKAQRKKEEKIIIRDKKCDPTVQISVSMR